MMRLLSPLLALAAALLPVPALAHVTAYYTFGDRRITIEAADNGDWRFEVSGRKRIWIIRRQGVEHVVLRNNGTDHATLADDIYPILLGPADAMEDAGPFEATKAGAGALAGYDGTLWHFGPRGGLQIDMLMSPDPRLAPIAALCRALAEKVLAPYFGREVLDQVFATGAPLRMGPPGSEQNMLESVSFAPIDPTRFAIPDRVIPTEDFRALLATFEPPVSTRIIVD